MPDAVMTNGIRVFYAAFDSRTQGAALYSASYDGVGFSGSNEPWAPGFNMPKLVGAPCAVWDRTGAYIQDGQPRLHVFVPVEGNKLWWLSTLDGTTVLAHSTDVGVDVFYKPSVVLIGHTLCLYYAQAGTGIVSQAFSREPSINGFTFRDSSPILSGGASSQAIAGCAATVRDWPFVAFGQGGDPSRGAPKLLYCANFDPTVPGSGTWTDVSPGIGGTGAQDISRTPAVTLLGDRIVMTYRVWGNDGSLFALSLAPDGSWSPQAASLDDWSTNGPGCCVWGERLYAFFQASQGGALRATAFVGNAWLPGSAEIPGSASLWFGPCAVTVDA